MRQKTLMRRLLSLTIAVMMIVPALASGVEAAIATWLSPPPGERISTRNVEVSVGFNTQSDVKVTRVELWIDGEYYSKKAFIRPDTRGVCSLLWDTARTSAGSHDLVVKLYAGDRLIATVSGTGAVGKGSGGNNSGYDLQPPTIRFANIKSGDVLTGTSTIRIAASDDSGDAPIISLLVDNALKLLKNRPPYTYDLDTTQYTDGSHQLETYAYDNAGNKSDTAVVKVAFKNGQERPVVAAMAVSPSPAPAPTSVSQEKRTPSQLPAIEGNKIDGAARSADQSAKVTNSASPIAPPKAIAKTSVAKAAAPASSKPVAAVAQPSTSAKLTPVQVTPSGSTRTVTQTTPSSSAKPATVAVAPRVNTKSSAVIAPPSSAKPVAVAVSIPSAKVRLGNASLANGKTTISSVEPPAVRNTPRISSPNAANPLVVLKEKVIAPKTGAMLSKAAEPPVSSTPNYVAVTVQTSKVKRNAMLPMQPICAVEPAKVARVKAAAPAEAKEQAVSSGVKDIAVAKPGAQLRSTRLAGSSNVALAPAMPKETIGNAISSAPKPTRVAGLPDVRSSNLSGNAHPTLACPPVSAKKDTNAKIEKSTIPASGKVKLRDLFDGLGGVVFWDPATHTVEASVGNLRIEMKIGSNLVTVNGKQMRVGTTPYLVDGRTIIDANLYHNACALIGRKELRNSAKAE